MDKNEAAAQHIKEALKEGPSLLQCKQIGLSDTREVIHIKGMELNATKEEVKQAITTHVGKWDENNTISELRPLSNNTKAATVAINKTDGEMLLKERHIRIGIVRCRIEKKLTIPRCYKCWSYDHDARLCNGPDRTRTCFKCGKEQHAARECNNEEYCPLCDTDDHRTGTNKCEAFKKALGRARRIERQVSRQTSQMSENNNELDNNKERQEDNNMETTEEAHKKTMEETEIEQHIAAFWVSRRLCISPKMTNAFEEVSIMVAVVTCS
ncbi:unnamed protein product [Psylliodes chrysocephalus]|uniref:CCHC-type domain-containing protein n=1 Tax=Psylliodes chrysocephalus TaxID=3402493 RepID=A0A9P0G6C8_9CUCU|nr:unnamed protein product [Psylliodes chrysocephala]